MVSAVANHRVSVRGSGGLRLCGFPSHLTVCLAYQLVACVCAFQAQPLHGVD